MKPVRQSGDTLLIMKNQKIKPTEFEKLSEFSTQ
jgi:hypothetical protein